MIFQIRFKDVSHVCHGFNGRIEIAVEPHTDGGINGSAEAGGFVKVRLCRGEPENVGGHLHCRSALRPAARNAKTGDGYLRPVFNAFLSFSEGVSQSFQDGTIEVSLRVDVTESNDRAFCFRTGQFQSGRPVGLKY